jgi:hypothetical protein
VNHVKCRKPACEFHVRADDASAEDVADGHREKTGHTVDVIADSIVRFDRASDLSGDPVGDDGQVGKA